MNRTLLLAILCLGLLAGCATGQKDKLRTETLDKYSILVRWNQFDALVDFIHPDYLAENPVSRLDVERLQQFRVTNYRVRQMIFLDDGSGVDRIVSLRMHNIHSSRERTVDYLEAWRWDDERGRWMLHSGLPDVTAGR